MLKIFAKKCFISLHKLLLFMQSTSPAVARGASSSSTKVDTSTQRVSPVPDEYASKPVTVTSSPPKAKNELQELLQRSGYALPSYEHFQPKGPSHKRQFTCKCVVKGHHDRVIHQTQGTGSTKKEAEMNSAAEMLPVIKAMLENGGRLVPVSVCWKYW